MMNHNKPKLMLPTIHLNGTSVRDLITDNLKASNAIQAAIDALREAGPNGRDYYPQDRPGAMGGAIATASNEHQARVAALQGALDELTTILEHLVDAENQRKPR